MIVSWRASGRVGQSGAGYRLLVSGCGLSAVGSRLSAFGFRLPAVGLLLTAFQRAESGERTAVYHALLTEGERGGGEMADRGWL